MFSSVGILNYSFSQSYGFRLVLTIDPDITRYYRSLIPKSISVKSQAYPAHISIVRKELPLEFKWGWYEGEEVEFCYDSDVCRDDRYFWLNCYSTRLEEIRTELGLPLWSVLKPPALFRKTFHCTLANTKEKYDSL